MSSAGTRTFWRFVRIEPAPPYWIDLSESDGYWLRRLTLHWWWKTRRQDPRYRR